MATSDTSKDMVGYFSHAVSREDLEPGDHIYCYRVLGAYSHHGIYTGKPKREVIHMSGPVGGRKSKSSIMIRAVTLVEFIDGRQLRIVAYNASELTKIFKRSASCSRAPSVPAYKAIEQAEYYLKYPLLFGEYNALTNNCDLFAVFCKTAEQKAFSPQVPIVNILYVKT